MARVMAGTDERALLRVLDAIETEREDAAGFLAGFLGGLSDHIAGLLMDAGVSRDA